MDNLPKSGTSDFSSFSGIYPDQTSPKAPEPPVEQPSAAAVPPPPMTTVAVSEPMAEIPSPPIPAEPALESPPSPFVAETPVVATPKGGGGGKRIFVFGIIFIFILLLGFIFFQFFGKLLTGSKTITLTYWGLWETDAYLTPMLTEYKKLHPNVEVVYTRQSPRQYRERLQAAIQRGEGPDVFRFHNTWVPMLRNELAPAGKTGYTAAEFQQAFYPVATQDLVINGKIYGAPLMFDGLALYYNEDLLRAAGATPPTSWEQFRQAVTSLTVKDENGKIVTAGAALGTVNNIEHFSDILAVLMLQNGADLKQPISKEAQGAVSFYRLFAEKPNNVWDETLDNSILAFANGKVAFIFAPSWQAHTIKQINSTLKFQIIPIPQLPGTNVTWASYWVEGVSAKSSHQEAAWEFLKFLTSKESELSLYTEVSKQQERLFGEPYSRVDLGQTVANDPFVGAYVRQAPSAKSFFLASRTFDNGINDRMIKYLEDGINSIDKGVSVDAALETVAAGFSQVLNSFGIATPASP